MFKRLRFCLLSCAKLLPSAFSHQL